MANVTNKRNIYVSDAFNGYAPTIPPVSKNVKDFLNSLK